MKLQEHLGKITWTVADKALYIMYGVVNIWQVNRLEDPADNGLFVILLTLNTWLFVVGDAFALQNMIQFGINKLNKSKVNLLSLISLLVVTLGGAGIIFLFREGIGSFFDNGRIEEVINYLPLMILLFIPRTFTIKITYRDYAFKKLFLINLAHFGSATLVTIYLIMKYHHLVFMDILSINLIGAGCGSVIGLLLTHRDLTFSWKGNIRYAEMFRFCFPLTFQATIHYLPKAVDVILLGYFFDMKVVGIYALAKTLFRVFDEAASASYGLIYPASVRLIENKNREGLNALMTKAISFMFLTFLLIFLLLESGFGRFMITTFMSAKYHPAVPQFNVILLAALFIPFTLLSLVINALGKTGLILRYVVTAFVVSLPAYYIIGKFGNPVLAPLGLVTYYAAFGTLCYYYTYRKLDFKPAQIFRAVDDSISFVRSFLGKRKLIKD